MFKKVKKDNGTREFYIGKTKIFQYVNSARFADFIDRKFNIIYDINMSGGGGKSTN